MTGGGEERRETLEAVRRVKDEHATQLRDYPNVSGIGVGYRVRQGVQQPEICVRVYVRRKLPSAELPPGGALPARVDDVGVDVVEADFAAQLTLAERQSFRRIEVPAGVSVGCLRAGAGTWGASVSDASGRDLLLSNWHVLCASNRCHPGEPIVQPGLGDGGGQGDVVARLTRWRLSERLDAACAELTGNRFATHEIADIGQRPLGTQQATLGMAVVKSGRTTGVTRGVVTDIDADVEVTNYPVYGTRDFVSQAIVEPAVGTSGPFSKRGDSGSLVLAHGGTTVGLLFAGDERRVTIMNKIDDVVSALRLDFGVHALAWERGILPTTAPA